MNNTKTWKLITESLERKVAVILLYVLESKGSSPGRQGFFMAINEKNETEGSIGGGIMEYKFVEMAKEQLKDMSHEQAAINIRKQIHDKSAAKNQSGMICSGEQTILFYWVKENNAATIKKLIASLEHNKNGTLALSPRGLSFDDKVSINDFEFVFRSEDDWFYNEKTGYKHQLFIIGGGHCALALSRLMRSMDFYIRVYDDRRNLKTMEENDAAHEKYLINDYAELKEIIPSGDHHYVVIMTVGYRTDDTALKALLEKKFNYIGLLGSQKKIEKVIDNHRRDGTCEELLKRVHTPVGIQIKSQTPEEIAVSIAAEIIQVKNQAL